MPGIPLNIGLIGCGRIAQAVHLKVLSRLPGVRVAAIAEPDAGRRAAAARLAPSATPFEDAAELLAKPGVDAVVIALPSGLHAAAAIAAFEAGKHVYLEKPLATRCDDGRKVLDSWRGSGKVGAIGFNYRFNPLHLQARRTIASGVLRELVGIRTTFTTAARPLPQWKRDRRTGGGVLLDLASHHVDLVPYLVGRAVEEVFASTASHDGEADNAAVTLRLTGGVVAQSLFSLGAVDEDRVEIYGRAGKLTVDRYNDWAPVITDPARQWDRFAGPKRFLNKLANVAHGWRKFRSAGHEPSYREGLRRFIQAAGGGAVEFPNLDDAYRSLEVIEAAEESARTARPIAL